jgi:hypothetical protein
VAVKTAFAVWAWLIVTVHVAVVPVHAPLQPPKKLFAAAVAVSVTVAPLVKFAEHVAPQSTPAGDEVTVPVPVPVFVIASGNVTAFWLNDAVTVCALARLTVHVVVVPVQAPLQPPNVLPVPAAAVSVTVVVDGKLALHVPGQVMPAGDEVTVPVPVPAVATVSVLLPAAAVLNVAVTFCAALIVTVQVVVAPVQAPVQPANVLPVAAAAVSVTAVPLANVAVHVVPQLMPAGLDVMVPVPVPARVSVSVCGAAVTVSATVCDALATLVPLPAIVIVYVPGAVVAAVASVRVLAAVVPVSEAGLNVGVTPVGAPVAASVTAPV